MTPKSAFSHVSEKLINQKFVGEAYEYATFLSVELKDIEDFERNICVLKSYYDEFDGVIPPS